MKVLIRVGIGIAIGIGIGTAAGEAQTFERVITPFGVKDEIGRAYAYPFIGGFDVPRPQFVDIDGDGDLDLFVQERSNELMFFENVGSAQQAKFVWRTDKYEDLDINEWNRFFDVDSDGDYDLLAEQPFSYIKFFRNEGTRTKPQFKLAADSMKDSEAKPIFADRQNIPNLGDIDCDGQPDLFLGRVEGTVTRYERIASTEVVPRFGFVTDRFEEIEIIGQLNGSMHGANTMYWADADGDKDLDLFWGDFFEQGVLLIQNVGSNCSSPNLRVEPQPVLIDGERLLTSGYNVPVLADIDGDGDKDFFVGVLGGAYNPNNTASDNFYFAERDAEKKLHLKSTRYIDGIDVGSESVPTFGDLDGDGDLDMLIGNKLDPKKQESGSLYLFKNTGTKTKPEFQLSDTLRIVSTFHQAPALGDVNGDGKLDLVLGTWNDGVIIFLGKGGLQFEESTRIKFTRGSNYTPALADVDGDGDLDIVAGEASGELNFVRNDGATFTLVSENWQGIDAGRRSHPAFVDIDKDGDLDLLIGREEGGSVFYRNDKGKFVADSSVSVSLHHNASPVFVDLLGDGVAELVAGGLGGGLAYYVKLK